MHVVLKFDYPLFIYLKHLLWSKTFSISENKVSVVTLDPFTLTQTIFDF